MEKIQFENNVTKANADTFNTMQDNIEDAINDITIELDDEVSTSSINGVENQAITNYVDDKILDTYSTSNTNTYSCDYINNNSGGTDTYSTTETLTNKIWVNGKPIYRKVIQINTINAGQTVISLDTTNVDEYLTIEGMAYSQNDCVPIPKVHNNDFIYQIGWFIVKSTNSLIIEAGSSTSGIIKGYAILEYTKTTD